jgi:LuxR family maltose regulon positive regulatory protein
LSREAGFLSLALVALGSQGVLCERQGELGQAAEIYHQALALGAAGEAQSGSPIPATGKAHVFLARVLYEWDQLEAALEQALAGLDCCQRWGHLGHLFDGYLQLIQIHHARQAPVEAQTALAAAKLLLSQATAPSRQTIPNHKLVQMTSQLSALELSLALRQGQVEPVKQWAQARPPDRPEFQLIWPRLWLSEGRFAQAARRLSLLRTEAETNRQSSRLLKILILEAAALQGQGETVPARLALAQALRLGEAGGYLRSFVDEGPPILDLLGQVLRAVPDSAYTARLLAALQTSRSGQTPTSALSGPLLEPLSERELETLRLVALNLSNQEIAAQLVVSLNTVKTHLKRLYAKLNARNRLEAIERGRELGLL